MYKILILISFVFMVVSCSRSGNNLDEQAMNNISGNEGEMIITAPSRDLDAANFTSINPELGEE